MLTRVRSRGVVRAFAFVSLLAVPLGAVADPPPPPVKVVYEPYYPPFYPPLGGPFLNAVPGSGYTGVRPVAEIPPVPIDHYPRCYPREVWTPLGEALTSAKRRNADPVPFDLTYLPVHEPMWSGPRAVVAVRPCALFDRPGGDRLARSLFIDTGILDFVKGLLGLRGMTWPTLHELDMVLCRVEFDVQQSEDGQHGKFNACANSAVLRTRERYDWKRQIQNMTPRGEKRTHRGFEYYATDVPPEILAALGREQVVKMGLFVADARTLVIDTEDYVKHLLDDRADGKPTEEPAGWANVNRGVFAVALSNPDKKWTRLLPGAEGPRLPNGGDWEYGLLDDLDELTIGLDDRPTTRFRLTATTNPLHAKRMTRNAKLVLALAEAHLAFADGPAADFVRAFWRNGKFTPTLRGFEITADAGTDLLGPLFDRLTPPAPAPVLQPHPGLIPLRGNGLGGF